MVLKLLLRGVFMEKVIKRSFSGLKVEMVTRKCTTQLLATLRQLMLDTRYVKEPLQAYIVPWNDAHNSEYVAPCDQQRAFISGFTGSAGTAVVTQTAACLWTDGRYYLQASQEMDENWTLMKESLPGTPSQASWLCKTLPEGSKVGADPLLMTHSTWGPFSDQLQACGHSLVPVDNNLVNLMWPDRPARPANSIKHLSEKFSGKSTSAKLADMRNAMKENGVCALGITALDELAWLLNMRGSDIAFCPVFFAYGIITRDGFMIFIDKPERIENDALEYLIKECGECAVLPYGDVASKLKEIASTEGDHEKIWLSATAPQALSAVVPGKLLMSQITPANLNKAIKNEIEATGMKNSHIRDGAALVRYFSWLEREVLAGKKQTELSAATQLEKFRSEMDLYEGLSFETISASGPNGAIIHYHSTPETNAPITLDQLYLCDSGGQYTDGTTDVTRTLHFGNPTEYEKECFTRVLKGQMSMGCAKFPEKVKGNCLDSFARRFLWDVGLDYQHGTGHGIGHFLNVHEGPMGISWRTYPEDPGLQAGMFLSNEPGYYEDGSFGIRLENIVQIVEANGTKKPETRKFLTFETVTMCPIQTKLICKELMTCEEIKMLNDYHKEVKEKVAPFLKNDPEALAWLERETQPI